MGTYTSIGIGVSVVLANVLVTRRLLHTEEPHKVLYLCAIWIFPVLGSLLVFMSTQPSPVKPSLLGGEHNPPGSGSL